MVNKLVMLWLLLLACVGANAQQQGAIPDEVLRGLAKDLAEMQRAVDDARRQQTSSMYAQIMKGYGVPSITVTTPSTPIRAGASDAARTLATAKPGTKYQVIDKSDQWYAVTFDRPIEGLTAGWVKASNAVPAAGPYAMHMPTPQDRAVAEAWYLQLVDQASKLKKAWQDNPYIAVQGFDINVGVPPSLSISFQFK